MTFTYEQAQIVINAFGLVWAEWWYILDNVILFTSGADAYSVLDGFIIAGMVVDMAWEFLDELRP